MRSATVAILAAGALVLAAAPAVAEHAYSHRYLVYGTVVDADGNPVEGVQVSVDLSSMNVENRCSREDRHQLTTDSLGRYWYCGHVHSEGSSTRDFTVTAAGKEKTVSSNPDLRRSHVNIQLDSTAQEARGDVETFQETYRLPGIVWKPDDTSLEGIGVNGVAIGDRPVGATLTLSNGTSYDGTFVGTPYTQNPNTTDRYGDFLFRWTNLPDDLSGAQVTVTSEEQTVTHEVDTTFRHSTAKVILPSEGLNIAALWIFGGLIVLGVGGYFAYEPVKDRWEERKRKRRMRRLEDESDRKRS